MRIRDVMSRGVESIGPEATVQEAAQRMAACNVGFLPVLRVGMPLGVITDRDIVVRSTSRGDAPSRTRVADVMTHDAQSVGLDTPAEEAAERMRQKGVRRLLVEDMNRKIVGVATRKELVSETRPARESTPTRA